MQAENEIIFHSEDIDFSLSEEENEILWIITSIESEKKRCGAINYIFCSDEFLLKINQEYLSHDTYTDIITFNYNEGDLLSSDIYISIDRVKENAQALDNSFTNELRRVMIHGILHLIGYDDKNPENQATMRAKEDFYLNLHPSK